MFNQKLLVPTTLSVRETLKRFSSTKEKTLLVVDINDKLIGIISDGDIRNHILKGESLTQTIETIYNPSPSTLEASTYTPEEAKKLILEKRIQLVPVLQDGHVVDVITWDQALGSEINEDETISLGLKNIPVLVMAGGQGTRMGTFTTVLPKPLIPIRDKTILQIIIDEFKKYGAREYYFTLNYRGEMIQAYFNGIQKDYKINYLWEENFNGTAGSLSLLPTTIPENFVVSNCDIVVKANYSEVLEFHNNHDAYLTLISSIQYHRIPYGVIKFKTGGEVAEFIEKPEHIFPINTGVYILSKKCLEYIPKDTHFDMPDLIQALFAANKKVMHYPVSENDYIDIGQWDAYSHAVEKLRL